MDVWMPQRESIYMSPFMEIEMIYEISCNVQSYYA
jgi:hypothetical protein